MRANTHHPTTKDVRAFLLLPNNRIRCYINLEIEDKGEISGIKEMRKHICYYLKNMPNASNLRNIINHLDTKKEVEESLKMFFIN